MTTQWLGPSAVVVDAAMVDRVMAALGAATRPSPTLAEHVKAVGPTFSDATAGTYGSYWRLAVEIIGDLNLNDITVVDLQGAVAEAVRRARQRRPGSTGRSSQETCVAALRALFSCAVAAGAVTTNPAAALTKPRRARSRRRALTDGELAELIDAIRLTSNDPDLDCSWCASTSNPVPVAKAPSTSVSATSTRLARPCGYERRMAATVSNPSRPL